VCFFKENFGVMDYNTGSLRVLLSEIYTTVLSCAEGVVPVFKAKKAQKI